MSFLKSLFRSVSASGEFAEAEALAADGRHGEAKLAFERAAARARKDGDQTVAESADAGAARARDAIASKRLDRAESFFAEGDLELAAEELRGARDVAPSQELLARANDLRDKMDARKNRVVVEDAPVSDEEIFAALAGSWVPEQASEYDEYGDAFVDAILSWYRGDADAAARSFESLYATAKAPIYLDYALGRALGAAGRDDEADAKLREFLGKIGPGEGGESRLSTHAELARIARSKENHEAAIAELEAAIEAFPEDYRPYLMLARLVREQGHGKEAVEILESAAGFVRSDRPDPFFIGELGLAYRDAKRPEEAVIALENLLKVTLGAGRREVLVEPSIALAELHEAGGNAGRAADIYRILVKAKAPNTAELAEKGAVLLESLSLDDEASALRLSVQG